MHFVATKQRIAESKCKRQKIPKLEAASTNSLPKQPRALAARKSSWKSGKSALVKSKRKHFSKKGKNVATIKRQLLFLCAMKQLCINKVSKKQAKKRVANARSKQNYCKMIPVESMFSVCTFCPFFVVFLAVCAVTRKTKFPKGTCCRARCAESRCKMSQKQWVNTATTPGSEAGGVVQYVVTEAPWLWLLFCISSLNRQYFVHIYIFSASSFSTVYLCKHFTSLCILQNCTQAVNFSHYNFLQVLLSEIISNTDEKLTNKILHNQITTKK